MNVCRLSSWCFFDLANHGLIVRRLDYSRVILFRSLSFVLPMCNSGKAYLAICKERINRERERSSLRLQAPGQTLCRESWRKKSKVKVVSLSLQKRCGPPQLPLFRLPDHPIGQFRGKEHCVGRYIIPQIQVPLIGS